MKITLFKNIALLLISVTFINYTHAQIITPEGALQGGSSKDTAHFVDKPSMHVHEQTIIINHKNTNTQATGKSGNNGSSEKPQAADTTQQAADQGAPTDTTGGLNNKPGGNEATSASVEVPVASRNQTMLYVALTSFSLAALIGLFLLTLILRNKKTSLGLTLMHGTLGLLGIGMLIAYSIFYPGFLVPLVIFAIAATGGLIIFYQDINNKPIPKWLVIIHGLVAVTGIVSLVVYTFYC